MSKIAEAILKVSFSVGHIEKNGKAEFGNTKYKFQAWDEVVPAVRNACVEHGLTIIPNIREIQRSLTVYNDQYGKEKQVPKVTVLMHFTLLCGDENMVFSFMGESLDTDDKSIQKAATSATKYFFLKTFMIPIEGEVDPDAIAGNLDQQEPPKTQRAPTQSAVAKAEVSKETTKQKERADRANKAFATLGCETIPARQQYEKQAKEMATRDGNDWVDCLEVIARDLVAA